MWQRIQTVFLGIAVLAGLLMFLFPVATLVLPDDGGTVWYTIADISIPGEETTIPWPVLALVIMVAGINAATIFLYKNRVTQLRLIKLNLVLATGLLAATVLYIDVAMGSFVEQGLEPSYGLALLMPVLIMVFTFLANRSIKKDEKLVRSMDRLR